MTQFMLVDLMPDVTVPDFLKVAPSQEMIVHASSALFGFGKATYELSLFFDEIYLAAQREIVEGRPATQTGLFQVLERLHPISDAIALWYANDYGGLPVTFDWDAFISRLVGDLQHAPFETYAIWKRRAD